MGTGLQRIFNKTASTYEMINHILAFGLDNLWRTKTAERALIIGGSKWLDVCSGTGELASRLYRVANSNTSIISSDFSISMMKEAQKKPEFQHIQQVLAESASLPFKNDTFDIVTISYATRNLSPTRKRLVSYLKEFHRVLKPRGFLLNLETSQPDIHIIRRLFHTYVQLAVRRLGGLISNSKAGYSYLAHSVQKFYEAKEFSRIILEAGFRSVRVKTFLFGIFAIHEAIA